ncbi:hypothetical protein, conserved [Babesia ovata]|uniref:Uncharacterized protein n=1 Tax=Babesia ovata TaxID=189622 RepID=A0A2H6KAT3_9APIC|nr:uncharacterized protein BOVATA_015910 [Babesia ovata]GBE60098.1 hypothetical protein, conserved [Babesia ovata]
MVYTSLTEVPRNLKEAIDWLIALKGTDADNNINAMGAALYDFLAEQPVGLRRLPELEKIKPITRAFLMNEELRVEPFVKDLLGRFRRPMNKNYHILRHRLLIVNDSDYKNVIETERLKPRDMANGLGEVVFGCERLLHNIANSRKYVSSYSSEATWANSCSANEYACAAVLVGIAPMLYAGLRALRAAGSAATRDSSCDEDNRVGTVLEALGYPYPESRASLDMSGAEVRTAMKAVKLHVLEFIYDIAGFWAFY